MPDRSTAALIVTAPGSVAFIPDNAPWKPPMALGHSEGSRPGVVHDFCTSYSERAITIR